MNGAAPRLPGGWRLLRFEAIGSTNDAAKDLARDGAAEGTLLWAREQTRGRGRRGRTWVSPPGNLYASLILRPSGSPMRAAQLGFVAALALGEALLPLLPQAAALAYKWPNDVLLNGRKIAGILLESEIAAGGDIGFVVVGVGANLASSPPDSEFPATSLSQEGIEPVAAEIVLADYAERFGSWLGRWREDGFAPVRAAWRARAAALGEPIRVRLEHVSLAGRFLDIDDEGTLLLEDRGACRRIAAGEVFPVNS